MHAKDAFVREQERVKRHATLEFLASTMERRHLVYATTPNASDPNAIREFLAKVASDFEANVALSRYLSYFEHLAVGVNTEALDIEIVDRAVGGTVIETIEVYGPWIEERRQARKKPHLYVEIEALAAEIQKRRAAKATNPN